MALLRVHNFSVSADGFAAGPDQDLDHPVGVDGQLLHEWLFAPAAGNTPGRALDDHFIRAGEDGIGATIMGRNMFGPIRGDWPDLHWAGWWGEDPPFHHPVFVLTHHPRPVIEMAGGTTFHFVDPAGSGGIDGVLDTAFDAADGGDVRLGGGVRTVTRFLRAGLVDELHLAVVPVLLGRGERLFGRGCAAGDKDDGGPMPMLPGFRCAQLVASGSVAHMRFVRSSSP